MSHKQPVLSTFDTTDTPSEKSTIESLPEHYNGWECVSTDVEATAATYVRTGSTHVRGAYTRLTISHRETDSGRHEWRLSREAIDKWGKRVSGTSFEFTDGEKDRGFDRCWRAATDKMDTHEPCRPFDGTPEYPDTVESWRLTHDELRETTWTAPTGEQLSLHRADVTGGYCSSTVTYNGIWTAPDEYDGPGPATVEFLSGEIHDRVVDTIVATMQTNPAGLTDSTAAAELLECHGIGPAKARTLQLCGISHPDDLKHYLDTGNLQPDSLWNRARDDLLKTTLTTRIKNNL